MAAVYFDITDIVQFAQRSNRLTGIQRVEFNLIRLLSQQYGGELIRCVFFHPRRDVYVEFDPAERMLDSEFDAERLLIDLGVVMASARYPSGVRIKSYLRANARSKWQRFRMKLAIYLAAWFAPSRLTAWDLEPLPVQERAPVTLRPIERLPVAAHLVHLGSSWFFPNTWRFAARHKAAGGDVVQYIHDLIPVTHPHFMPAKEPAMFVGWLEQALQYATRFPCNSRWTANDLRRFVEARGAQCGLHVVPLAHEFVGHARGSEPALPQRLAALAGRRFVLCVGTIEARKNALSLLKVWQQLHAQLGTGAPLLVFAGRFGKIGGEEVRRYIEANAQLSGMVRVIDGPSDQVMAWLYRNCLFSVYPSFVEGWGLPVGESVWFGRYCVASRASSIPEVCDDLVGYIDPDDLASIHAEVSAPLREAGYLQKREAVIAAAPLRTWQDVADELYEYIVGADAVDDGLSRKAG